MSAARRTIGIASSQWELHAWHQCAASAELWTFSDRNAAGFWLRQFNSDPTSMAGLRAAVLEHGVGLPLGRNTDEKLLEELSWLLSKGVLHVHRIPAPRTAWRIESESSPADTPAYVRPTVPQSSAPPPPKVIEEADTFTARTDAEATAAVLRAAAESGVPFCEECGKAAAARMAA